MPKINVEKTKIYIEFIRHLSIKLLDSPLFSQLHQISRVAPTAPMEHIKYFKIGTSVIKMSVKTRKSLAENYYAPMMLKLDKYEKR